MIRRLALTAGLAVVSAVVFVPKAHAQTAAPAINETVEFEGTVGSVCTFDGTKGGILDQPTATVLDSETPGGTSGQTKVNCTGGGVISVDVAPGNVPPGFTPDNVVAKVTSGPNSADSEAGDSFDVPPGDVNLDVDLLVEDSDPLPPGLYQYDVMVTAAPQ